MDKEKMILRLKNYLDKSDDWILRESKRESQISKEVLIYEKGYNMAFQAIITSLENGEFE